MGIASLVCLGSSSALADDVASTAQIDAAHTGLAHTNIKPPLKIQWVSRFPGIPGYAVIADGRVFVTFRDMKTYTWSLYALSAATGKVLWGPYSTGWNNVVSSPAYSDGQVYIMTNSTTFGSLPVMKAFDAKTGHINWSLPLPDSNYLFANPVALNGIVYACASGGYRSLYAVNAKGGSLLWTAYLPGDIGLPAVTEDGVYAAFGSPGISKIDPKTGKRIWNCISTEFTDYSPFPVVYKNRVYTSGRHDPVNPGFAGTIVDADTGLLLNHFGPDRSGARCAPVFDGDRGYYLLSGTLYAADADTLTHIQWKASVDEYDPLTVSPVVVNGVIYTGTNNGIVYGFDEVTGSQVCRFNPNIYSSTDYTTDRAGLSAAEGIIIYPSENSLLALSSGIGMDSFTIDQPRIVGGLRAYGTVTLNAPAPAGGMRIAVSSKAHAAQVPASVTVAPGKTAVTFPITTSVTTGVIADIAVTSGAQTIVAELNVGPNWITSATMTPSTVTGGEYSLLSFTLAAPAPAGGFKVYILSDSVFAQPVLGMINVPEGKTKGNVVVMTGQPLIDVYANLYASPYKLGSGFGWSKIAPFTIKAN